MTATEILAKLKQLAPNIAITTATTPDPHFEWDGDGPDPQDEGYEPCDVDVTATAILDGELVEGEASMGGHYVSDDDPDPDFGGYLPQMIEESLQDLAEAMTDKQASGMTYAIGIQIESAITFIKAEMKDRYDRQMAERNDSHETQAKP